MNYIVVDIERNSFPYQTKRPSEIVEIAAVKINEQGMVIEEFSSLIKPTQKITKFTTKLTGIEQEMVEDAPRFSDAYKAFKQFFGEHAAFVSWGREDLRFLETDCAQFQLQPPVPEAVIDIQEVLMYGIPDLFSSNTPGLKAALDVLGLETKGENHRALSDAQDTAEIFRYVQSRIDVHGSYKPERTAMERFTKNNRLNMGARKKYSKWIRRTMEQHKTKELDWETFSQHSIWQEAMEKHAMEPELVALFQSQFADILLYLEAKKTAPK